MFYFQSARQGAADRGEHREAAGAVGSKTIRLLVLSAPCARRGVRGRDSPSLTVK
jgi:hypothetical protein